MPNSGETFFFRFGPKICQKYNGRSCHIEWSAFNETQKDIKRKMQHEKDNMKMYHQNTTRQTGSPNRWIIIVRTVRAPVVGASADPCFYCFYSRGGRFESGTEQTEFISMQADRNAGNKLNLLESSNAWQGGSNLYY